MSKTIITTSRSLLLAGALAFAALPVLAQTAPSTQPAAPVAGGTVTPGTAPAAGKTTVDTGKTSTDAGKTVSDAGKSTAHGKKLSATTSKTKIHKVSAKKHVESKVQPPATSGNTAPSAGTDPAKKL
jgi:hypothetical protein